jgi:hypothetical protein
MTKGIAQYEVGEQVDLYFLIKSSTRGIASNGKPFLTVILQDKTGDIEAKLWDASPDDEANYAAQKIVRAAGDASHSLASISPVLSCRITVKNGFPLLAIPLVEDLIKK